MREYKKPIIEVEKFMANVAVASCEGVFDYEEWRYGEQTISCLNGTQDSIFGESCDMQAYGVTYLEETTTFTNNDNAILALRDMIDEVPYSDHTSSSGTTLTPGWYAVWYSDGNNDHAGEATGELLKYFTHSY